MGIRITGGDKFKNLLKELQEKYPDVLNLALDDTADAMSLTAQRIVPVDTGRLRASINVKREYLSKVIGTNVEYAQPVEYGTPYREGTRFMTKAFESNKKRVAEFFIQNL